MPQLEVLGISFNSYLSQDEERQMYRMPIMTHVTLPNVRWFAFHGASTYLEALLPRLAIPLLERLQVYSFIQLTYSIPHLQEFMDTAGNLPFKTASLTFSEDNVNVMSYPQGEARMYTLDMKLGGRHLDWQVASAAQVFRTVFSTVEHLSLQYRRHQIFRPWNNKADITQWRELLGLFDNVKTVHVDDELVGQLSHSLQPGEGESSTDLLSELQVLSYPAIDSSRDAFSSFIDGCQKVGRPVPEIYFFR